jgi:hypothetical protein
MPYIHTRTEPHFYNCSFQEGSMKTCITLFVVITLTALQSSYAQIPRTLSYQAILTDLAGTPRPDGPYTVTFRLYGVASGGAVLWTESQVVQVKRGLFSAVLGNVTPLGPTLTFTQPYWLSLQVAPESEIPSRLPLTSVGYSFNALKADSARYAQGTVAPAPLALTATVNSGNYVLSSTATGTGSGIIGASNSEFGVVGQALGTSGVNIGVVGNSRSPDGFAMSGWNLATTGFAIGVRGLTNSPSGWGVYGIAGSTTGIGVVGQALGNTGINYGVVGNSGSADGFAISGWNLATSGAAVGVVGRTNSPVGTGIQGFGGTNGLGVLGSSVQYGVKGTAVGTNGSIGIWGEATANVNDVRGVYGTTMSPQGNAIVGENLATSGAGRGIWGLSHSPQGVGVFGSTTDPNGWAGYFDGKVATKSLQILGGSDVAEPFDTGVNDAIEPGSVMVIDALSAGKLALSATAYDGRVAGIVSGAGGVKPGITLQQSGILEGKSLVAIAGRVYCKADARSEPIEPGDLLTTSNIPGHAMKATDRDRSRGAIIGKAMSGLKQGTGLVLVLVNLQ